MVDYAKTIPFILERLDPNGVIIDDTDSPYQAKVNDFILADSTDGNISIFTPLNAIAGERFIVKKTSVVNINVPTIDAGSSGSLVESQISHTLLNKVSLISLGEVWTLIYDGTNWLIESISLDTDYTELWSATPIASVSDVGTTIQWTFVPLVPGQTPTLVSHLSGVFTSNVAVPIAVKFSNLWTYQINANNQDAFGLITDVASVPANMSFIEIISSFTSPRTKVGGFPFSQNTEGIWAPAISETLKFDAFSDLAQSGDTDLTEAFLFLSVG